MNVSSGRPSILLVTDRSVWGDVTSEFTTASGALVSRLTWQHGEALDPDPLGDWEGDWIVGFKADYILSEDQLKRARHGAINFHPGPPELRGIGTYEVALDRGAETYGVTCHHMVKQVDAGRIIDVLRFPIQPKTGTHFLREQAATQLYLLYLKVMPSVLIGASLPVSTERWEGPLHTWAELQHRAD